MPFDFPNSPTTGQTTIVGGVVYVYDGSKWVVQSQTTQAQAALNNVGRNLIHNALFNVQQRGTGPWSTNGAYTADRWSLSFNLDTPVSAGIISASDAMRTAVGDEAFLFALTTTFTGSAGAAAFTELVHKVEGVRRIAGKTVTLSFWAWCSTGALKLGFSGYQLFGTGGSPSAAVAFSRYPIQLSTAVTRYSITFAVPSAVGKTFGTNGDDHTALQFFLSSGATNFPEIGVQSGTIGLWGVQLEIGSTMTQLEKVDPGEELRRCQRFYTAIINYQTYGCPPSATLFGASFTLPVTMRAVPSSVTLSNMVYGNCSGASVDHYAASSIGLAATSGGLGFAFFSGDIRVSADL